MRSGVNSCWSNLHSCRNSSWCNSPLCSLIWFDTRCFAQDRAGVRPDVSAQLQKQLLVEFVTLLSTLVRRVLFGSGSGGCKARYGCTVAQTVVGRSRNSALYSGPPHAILLRIGWVEGQGNVCEQSSKLNEMLAKCSSEKNIKNQYLGLALNHAKRAKKLFKKIDNQQRLGKIESSIRRLNAEILID